MNFLVVSIVTIGAVTATIVATGMYLTQPKRLTTTAKPTEITVQTTAQSDRWKGHSETRDALSSLSQDISRMKYAAHASLPELKEHMLSNAANLAIVEAAPCMSTAKQDVITAIEITAGAVGVAHAGNGVNDRGVAPVFLIAADYVNRAGISLSDAA